MTRYRLLALATLALTTQAVGQPPTVRVPEKVAPPTPEQVQAVPAGVLEALQSHFDPNVTPAAASVPPPTNVAPPANPLVGTRWERQTDADRFEVVFAANHIEVTTRGRGTYQVSITGDCAYGPGGLVFGVLTTAEFPTERDPANLTRVVAAAGAPFCFRARLVGDTLTVTDLRCDALGPDYVKEFPKAARLALGTYRRPTPPGLPDGLSPPAGIQLLPPAPTPTGGRLPPTPVAPFPPAVDPNRLPPTPVEPIPPPPVLKRSSLDTLIEMAQDFAAENPAVVRAVATEAGRAVGGRIGREIDQPRAGEVIGVMIGSAVADRLIGPSKPKPTRPTVEVVEPTELETLAFWLGADRPTW